MNVLWKDQIPQKIHFIGIAGVGMSALAQFLRWNGFEVSGSDRQFAKENPNEMKLKAQGIICTDETRTPLDEIQVQGVVVSTAIESNHPQINWATEKKIPIIHRSELLAILVKNYRSIAIAGTSGKSTTTAMIFHIMRELGIDPSVITGAGLCDLEEIGLIGNAWSGKGEWLIVEADESDGTVEKYEPEIGVLLNIDRDHKELDELNQLFSLFKKHTRGDFIVWSGSPRTRALSVNQAYDFGKDPNCGFCATHLRQDGLQQYFKVQNEECLLPIPGEHNRDNALAALATVVRAGFDLKKACEALRSYPGIHRRFQILVNQTEFTLVDDFAHNPAKIAAALRAAQSLNEEVHAWFQPHGFAPTQFMKDELLEEISNLLRSKDSFCFGEIYYAGGTVQKTISSQELVKDLNTKGLNSDLIHKEDLAGYWLSKLNTQRPLFLVMGARDPLLANFTKDLSIKLTSKV